MLRASVAISALVLAGGLGAQSAQNLFIKYDGNVEYTARGRNGSQVGFVSQGYAHGFTANLKTLTYIRYWIQDQNAMTQEPWNAGFTSLDAAADPDYGNVKVYASNQSLPILSGIRAFQINHSLLTNPQTPPVDLAQWHHTWEFTKTTNWTADGLGVWISWGASYRNTRLCNTAPHREIPRIDGQLGVESPERFGWSSVAGQTRPGLYNDCSWVLRLHFAEPVLNGGSDNITYNAACPNPNPGYASIDPDFADNAFSTPGRFDDYQWTVEAGPQYSNGIGVMFMSETVIPGGGINIPGFGQLHLNLGDPLFGIGPFLFPPLDANGRAVIPFKLGATNGPLRPIAASFASWSAQALVIGRGQPNRLSNLFTFRPKLTPVPFTAARAVKGTPAVIPKTIQQLSIYLRNDGRGEVVIQPKRSSVNIGPPATVAERTAVRIVLPAAATTVEVSSQKTTAAEFVYAYNR